MVPVRYHIHSFAPMPFYVHISVFEGDGSIAVSHGGIEMGQGINTKVAQTIAKQLNVPVEMVVVKPSETLTTKWQKPRQNTQGENNNILNRDLIFIHNQLFMHSR